MPFTENYLELRYGGSAWAGQETWSCGLKLKQLGGDSPAAMQDNAIASQQEFMDNVEAYFTDQFALFGGALRLEWVRANVISATTGKYFYPNSPNVFEYETPVVPPAAGQGAGNRGYPQIAYCVTTRSALRRGPGSKGRWYVPCAIAGGELVTSTGVMPISQAQVFADAAGTFLDNLANMELPGEFERWSPWLYGDGDGGPVDAAIQNCSVGNVYDTQRRRRNQIEETYAPSTTYDPTD